MNIAKENADLRNEMDNYKKRSFDNLMEEQSTASDFRCTLTFLIILLIKVNLQR